MTMRTMRHCPELTAVNVDVFRCNPGLGVSRHPPVIRFRQAFKASEGGTPTLPHPSSRCCCCCCWAGMLWTCLLFALLCLAGSCRFLGTNLSFPFTHLSPFLVFPVCVIYLSPSVRSSAIPTPGWPSTLPETLSSIFFTRFFLSAAEI